MYLFEVYIDSKGKLVIDKVPILKETAKQYQVQQTVNYRVRIDKREIGEVVPGVSAEIPGQYYKTKYVICLPEGINKAKQDIYKAIVEEIKKEEKKLEGKKQFYRGFISAI